MCRIAFNIISISLIVSLIVLNIVYLARNCWCIPSEEGDTVVIQQEITWWCFLTTIDCIIGVATIGLLLIDPLTVICCHNRPDLQAAFVAVECVGEMFLLLWYAAPMWVVIVVILFLIIRIGLVIKDCCSVHRMTDDVEA